MVVFVAGIFSASFTKYARKMLGRNLAFVVYCLIAGSAFFKNVFDAEIARFILK